MSMEKQYKSADCEQEIKDFWQQERVYAFTQDETKQTFSIDTPPPTVSGVLHIGHIFSYTHTDLIARYKRMSGHNVFYPMGFDDNGLPTERFVEKKNNTKAFLMPRSEFIALCLRETHAVEKTFEELWRSMGLSIDWDKVYSTISEKVRKISQYSFVDLYNKGIAYKKEEPALYCTTCRTSVAQAELDNIEQASTFNDLIFTSEDGDRLTIATTRPELLPACVAIFFHPDDERYKHLCGKYAVTPVFEKKVKILPDDKVDPAKGTGLVMCCTFGDQTDIFWFKKHNLDYVYLIGMDGKFTREGGFLHDKRVPEARKLIIEELKKEELLLNQKNITHSVNVHERCKQEIEYVILNQWFIKILDFKDIFIAQADKINWYPAYMKARYIDWVSNLNWDWCISRQRFFGIPFPVWHCLDCGHVIMANTDDLPVDPQETPVPGGKCEKCSSTNIQPETDVMDTWNTSALTPQINANWPEQSPDNLSIPMSMRPQAHDIIRTWAFDTIIKAHFHQNTIPWNDIVISGHVLAGKEKISKSKGNSKMSPDALLSEYPADAVRYWAAHGRLGQDTAFSENQLKVGQRLLTKLWNAFRFCEQSYEQHYTSHNEHYIKQHSTLSQWLLHELSKSYKSYQQFFQNYEYHFALETAEKFFWHIFCDNYLELIKDQIFNPDQYCPEIIANTHYVLYEAGFAILQMFAPFTPYITENLYLQFFSKHEQVRSLHLTQFDNTRYEYSFEKSTGVMNKILDIVGQVRRLKSENQISLKQEVEQLILYCNDQALLEEIAQHERLISGISKAKTCLYKNSTCEGSLMQEDNQKYTAHIKIDGPAL
ncbi:MAG: valine--tRNA ligase [Epsilonproteobacteria bacterium]|nr:valine--tRNA ligase [Campylobacterota bacterium]